MSLPLLHSPAKVVAQLLTALNIGVPVFATNEPTAPDACVTVYNTTPVADGRTMVDGEQQVHWGIQLRVRAADPATAFANAAALRDKLDTGVPYATVVIAPATYLVPCFAKTTLLDLGKAVPTSKRSVCTINCLVPLRRTA